MEMDKRAKSLQRQAKFYQILIGILSWRELLLEKLYRKVGELDHQIHYSRYQRGGH